MVLEGFWSVHKDRFKDLLKVFKRFQNSLLDNDNNGNGKLYDYLIQNSLSRYVISLISTEIFGIDFFWFNKL